MPLEVHWYTAMMWNKYKYKHKYKYTLVLVPLPRSKRIP